MAPGGVIAFHISNQYLDLAAGAGANWRSQSRDGGADGGFSRSGKIAASLRARWVLLGERRETGCLTQQRRSARVSRGRSGGRRVCRLWTDDYLEPAAAWCGGVDRREIAELLSAIEMAFFDLGLDLVVYSRRQTNAA